MANSPNSILLGEHLIQRIATEFDWKEFVAPDRPRIGPSAVLLLAEPKATAPGTIRAYQQLEPANSGDFAVDKQTLISVGYTFLNRGQIQDAIQALKFKWKNSPSIGTPTIRWPSCTCMLAIKSCDPELQEIAGPQSRQSRRGQGSEDSRRKGSEP